MEDLSPHIFYLSQNYPDPFKIQTSIKYCLPKKTKMRLELCDYKGKTLRVLVNEIKESGMHQTDLKGKGLKEGIYLYRMRADGFQETKRMLLKK